VAAWAFSAVNFVEEQLHFRLRKGSEKFTAMVRKKKRKLK
jgi:hypothetical protein